MFEYHGWLVLKAAPHDTPTAGADVATAVESVRRLMAVLGDTPGLRDLRWVNGRSHFHVGGRANHRPPEFEDLLIGLQGVVARAAGTYGLIHYRDDEDADHHDEFRVLVVRRGTITEHADPYLSPLVPMIEDEDTGDGL